MTMNTNRAEENFSLYVGDLALMKHTVGYRQHVIKLIDAAASQDCVFRYFNYRLRKITKGT